MTELLGYTAAAIVALTQVPQLLKTVRTRDVEGLSRKTYTLIVLGSLLYIPYALALHSIPVLLTNAWIVLVAGTILAYIIRFGD